MRALTLSRIRVVMDRYDPLRNLIHHRVYDFVVFRAVLRKKDSVPIWKKVRALGVCEKLFPGDLAGYDDLHVEGENIAKHLGLPFIRYLRHNQVADVSLVEILSAALQEQGQGQDQDQDQDQEGA